MRINLANGRGTALVDDADWPLVREYSWRFCRGYAITTARRQDGTEFTIRMHRLIMGVLEKPHIEIDHRNGEGLDNRRTNLRIATRSANMANRVDPNSGRRRAPYKGIRCRSKNFAKPWEARITVGNKERRIGYFATPEEAAMAYDRAAIEAFGEFAQTNLSIGTLAKPAGSQ